MWITSASWRLIRESSNFERLSLPDERKGAADIFLGSFNQLWRVGDGALFRSAAIFLFLVIRDFMFTFLHPSVWLGDGIYDGSVPYYKCVVAVTAVPSSVSLVTVQSSSPSTRAETFPCLFLLFMLTLPPHEVTIPLFLFHFLHIFFNFFFLPICPFPLFFNFLDLFYDHSKSE